MNNVNMTDIAHKIHFLYKDECERNIAAMVIFYNNGRYFFDEKYKNEMANDEVEALLLRGALVYKDGKYVKPSSFDNSDVSFDGNIVIGGDGEVNLTNYYTKTETDNIIQDYVDEKINKIEPDSPNVRYIAHRGFSSKAPENTIPAYEEAGKSKYWGAETDIAETSDGEFILMHDNTVDRTTNGTGKVSDMTLEQIKALTIDAGSNILRYSNLKVPTLREYLLCCKRYNMVPIIECKVINNIEGFLNIIKELNMEKQVIVISFNNNTLKTIREYNKNIRMQTLSYESIEICKQYNFDVDLYDTDVNANLVNQFHTNGIEVNVWTINDNTRRLELESYGVDYITTDSLNNAQVEATNIQVDQVSPLTTTDKLQNDVKMLVSMLKTTNNISEFKVEQFDFSPGRIKGNSGISHYDFMYGKQNYGEDTRMYSNPMSTLYQKQLMVTLKDTTLQKLRIAVHGYDINLMFKQDFDYINTVTPIDISECPYIVLYVNADNIGQISAEIEQQIETGLTIYLGDDLTSIQEEVLRASLPEGVTVQDGYELTSSTLLKATSGVTNNSQPFPAYYAITETPTSKVVYPNLLKARNVKLKVTWNSEKFRLSMHLFDKYGYLLDDPGWGTSGQVYNATNANGFYYTIVGSCVSGTFTEELMQEFLASIVIEIVQ